MNLAADIHTLWRAFFGRTLRARGTDGNHENLQKKIGYTFSNPSLLAHALRHKSAGAPNDRKGLASNERLEFLGDAVLNCCVTDHLFHTYPHKSEGELSKIKSLVVSRKILGERGREIALGDYLQLGHGEKESGGNKKSSIISNAFESLIGALYLDGGMPVARSFLQESLFCKIEELLQEKSNINFKSRILELSQRDGFGIPAYSVLATNGPDHAKTFSMQVSIAGVPLGEGSGPNKKSAEQNAARSGLKNYEKIKPTLIQKGVDSHELVSD